MLRWNDSDRRAFEIFPESRLDESPGERVAFIRGARRCSSGAHGRSLEVAPVKGCCGSNVCQLKR